MSVDGVVSAAHTNQDTPQLATLIERISAKTAVIGVMGMGYVGLPLVSTFHRAGFKVLGFDTDPEVITALEQGESYLEHLKHASALFRHLADSPSFTATSDMGRLAEADAILVCVPTPLGEHFEPDLSYVEACGRCIAKTLREGQLIVLESTTYPGRSWRVNSRSDMPASILCPFDQHVHVHSRHNTRASTTRHPC